MLYQIPLGIMFLLLTESFANGARIGHRHKRDYSPSHDYNDYSENYSHDFYFAPPNFNNQYPQQFDYNSNSLTPLGPLGLAGGAGIALKALKVKKAVKGLKLLSIPLGLALAGGIAALVSGALPPAIVGGINLPFQG